MGLDLRAGRHVAVGAADWLAILIGSERDAEYALMLQTKDENSSTDEAENQASS
jgi:hypothetical protein